MPTDYLPFSLRWRGPWWCQGRGGASEPSRTAAGRRTQSPLCSSPSCTGYKDKRQFYLRLVLMRPWQLPASFTLDPESWNWRGASAVFRSPAVGGREASGAVFEFPAQLATLSRTAVFTWKSKWQTLLLRPRHLATLCALFFFFLQVNKVSPSLQGKCVAKDTISAVKRK